MISQPSQKPFKILPSSVWEWYLKHTWRHGIICAARKGVARIWLVKFLSQSFGPQSEGLRGNNLNICVDKCSRQAFHITREQDGRKIFIEKTVMFISYLIMLILLGSILVNNKALTIVWRLCTESWGPSPDPMCCSDQK